MENTGFTEALSYIYEIYAKFITFVFDEMEMFENVTFGWVIFACAVMALLISNLLTLPARNRIFFSRKEYVTKKKIEREFKNMEKRIS